MNNANQSFGPPPISDPALRPFLDGDDEAGLANRPMSVLERPRARSIGGAYRCKVFGFLGCGGSPAGGRSGSLNALAGDPMVAPSHRCRKPPWGFPSERGTPPPIYLVRPRFTGQATGGDQMLTS
jgi:hypothetical protein